MPRPLGLGFGFMHRADGVLGRRVERAELERGVPHVDDIVPRARGNDDGIVSVHARFLPQRIATRAHIDLGAPLLDADELIHVGVHLRPDIPAYGNAHKGELHILPRPECGAEIAVHGGGVMDVADKRLISVIADLGMLAARTISHKSTSFTCLPYQYIRELVHPSP